MIAMLLLQPVRFDWTIQLGHVGVFLSLCLAALVSYRGAVIRQREQEMMWADYKRRYGVDGCAVTPCPAVMPAVLVMQGKIDSLAGKVDDVATDFKDFKREGCRQSV